MKLSAFILSLILFISFTDLTAQQTYWHNKERQWRYTPEGEDFVIINGDKKFNRALYGTNTAFRVETGDVPEFGFFMPNMGGNLQLGLIRGNESIWLNNAEYIKSIYRAGARIYEIKDPVIGSGEIIISVLAMSDAEGMIMKIETKNIPSNTELFAMYGGASNKRFSRNGDLGVDDPTAFSLKPDACKGNEYTITNNSFSLIYGRNQKGEYQNITGIFPDNSDLKLGSPDILTTPINAFISATNTDYPVLVSKFKIAENKSYYINIKKKDQINLNYSDLQECFNNAENKRKEIAGTVKINTPDPYFNPLGGVISTAADGIWEPDRWLHGAVGWRMPLNGWRAAYTGDAIGWHDKSRGHFEGYAASQITNVEPTIPHPAQDKELNLARAEKKWGTQMYSNGYICRNPYETNKMHHYDMNLVYIDELLWHFNWTGDMDFVRKMWPVLARHLAWEKRNFDPDDDGLYDAYACIWASDALQYNSGGVTHSSAYNYRANKMAAMIAEKIGEDPAPYQKEADKILNAINNQLWLEDKGWWAEFKDFMGNKMVHPNAGIWTVYHAIDSDIHTPFQAYQATRYIDTEIPHIPVLAKGLKDEGYQTVSTTNWLPYSWSINNVAFAEVAHMSLAYWQAGRYDEAYKLFKSSVLDGMYLGSSPGNIGQVSFYDAARGECYRDFGDPVGVYSRVLVQGLFGVYPDLMNDKLGIRPGFPSDWDHASISTSDISIDFKRKGNKDTYRIGNKFGKKPALTLSIKAIRDNIASLKVNGKEQEWHIEAESVEYPLINIDCGSTDIYDIEITWGGKPLNGFTYTAKGVEGENWILTSDYKIKELYDPQKVLTDVNLSDNSLSGKLNGELGHRTLFVKAEQGEMVWWQPVNIEIKEPFSVNYNPESDKLEFAVTNNTKKNIKASLKCDGYDKLIVLESGKTSEKITIPNEFANFGTNRIEITDNGKLIYSTELTNWNIKNPSGKYDMIDINSALNASVSQIFKNEYLTPRSPYTTLQTPKQGIGEWCHPNMTANIDDSGLRNTAKNNVFETPIGIPFRTPSDKNANNIAFTTLWDNYPSQLSIPLSGKASHVYLLMAGSTNHMQCHVTNGTVTIYYTDGSKEELKLVNPETWAPVEQDFYIDGYAFKSKKPLPYRVALKSGLISRNPGKDLNIDPNEVYGRSIDGGAGIILDLPLDASKELKNLELKTVANEVVIGLMSVTLLR
ncbi:MAG: DUF4450 domain-containing protein [Dysgonomonas sp.]